MSNDSVKINLLDVFSWGVDYGQLTMEREREQELVAAGLLGAVYSARTAMPLTSYETRQLRSARWFEAKQASYSHFLKLISELQQHIFLIKESNND